MTLTAADIPFASTRAKDRWRLLTDVELADLPSPSFDIDGFMQTRSLVVIYGPSGSCKTTFESSLEVALATGRNFYGHRVLLPGISCYVGAEDVAGWKVRFSAARRAASIPASQSTGCLTFPDALDLCDSGEIDRFVRFVRDSRATLSSVCFDTFAASTPGASENSSEDMTAAISNAQKVRDALDVTVRIIHHSNASGSRERGHSSMRGAADTMICLTPVDDSIHVECSKQRNAAPFEPVVLKLVPVDGGGCVLRLAADVVPTATLTATQEKVLRVLKGFSQEGATKSEWLRAAHDVNERSFHRAAAALEEQLGLVQRVNGRFRVLEASHDY